LNSIGIIYGEFFFSIPSVHHIGHNSIDLSLWENCISANILVSVVL
jgi:hypothetical protein